MNTLSAVLEKLIDGLCLNDFPCGCGSWSKTKDNEESAETEDKAELLYLQSSRHSPWQQDNAWSPQASALRQLAVCTPEYLDSEFIHNYFKLLHIVDKEVSLIDKGLLKFSNLEELVLSANKISEVPAKNLPGNLKILDLRANRLSALNSLTSSPPPGLQYLGLGSNNLGSQDDVALLKGTHWPQLVCLDLSDCEFQSQRSLLDALSTLPRLRTLMLEGNPLTLAISYPGFTLDGLPRLSHLDASWISPEQRQCFSGLAKIRDPIVDQASVTVKVGKMKGILDPQMAVTENSPDFPVLSYSYVVTYMFHTDQASADQDFNTEPKDEIAVMGEHLICKNEKPHQETQVKTANHQETEHKVSHANTGTERSDTAVKTAQHPEFEEFSPSKCTDRKRLRDELKYSTSKKSWCPCVDFEDTKTYMIGNLGGLKKFLHKGLQLKIEQEVVLSWPVNSEDTPGAKLDRNAKGEKGKKVEKVKEVAVKSACTKSKDKKKQCQLDMVQDPPIWRVLGSVHVPLQSLSTGEKVDILCDFGEPLTDAGAGVGQMFDKDTKEMKKLEPKREVGNSMRKSAASLKGKGKGKKDHELEDSMSLQQQPMTVELSVELHKWKCVSEAKLFH